MPSPSRATDRITGRFTLRRMSTNIDRMRTEAQLWVTWRALTGEALPEDAAALVSSFPEVAHAADPRLPLKTRVIDTDREERPVALFTTIERPYETWHLIGLLNWRDNSALYALQLARCGLTPGDEWIVADFWGRASLGIASHAVGRRLGGRSCLLLSLRANLRRPQIVGTTRHLSMGGVEMNDIGWNDATETLHGQVGPDAVDIMLRVPHPYRPIAVEGSELTSIAEARASLSFPAAPGWRTFDVRFNQVAPDVSGRQPLRFLVD